MLIQNEISNDGIGKGDLVGGQGNALMHNRSQGQLPKIGSLKVKNILAYTFRKANNDRS